MKRCVAVFLSLAILFAVAGCGQTAQQEESAKRDDGILIELSDSGISVDGNNLKLNLPNVTEDTQFYIYYVEKTVPYGARYFMQNVYNDLYTEKVDVLSEEDKAKMYGYPGDKPDETIIYPSIPAKREDPVIPRSWALHRCSSSRISLPRTAVPSLRSTMTVCTI